MRVLKSKTTFSDVIGVLLDPPFWMGIKPICLVWDAKLNDLMDNNEVKRHGCHHAVIGETHVWAASYPYAYGYAAGGLDGLTGIPKRKTRIRLHNKLIELLK